MSPFLLFAIAWAVFGFFVNEALWRAFLHYIDAKYGGEPSRVTYSDHALHALFAFHWPLLLVMELGAYAFGRRRSLDGAEKKE